MVGTQNGQVISLLPDNRYPDPLAVYQDKAFRVSQAMQYLNVKKWQFRDMLKWSSEDGRPLPGSEFPNAYQNRPPTSRAEQSTSPIMIPMFDIYNYIVRVTQGLTFDDLCQMGLYVHPGTDEKEFREGITHAI